MGNFKIAHVFIIAALLIGAGFTSTLEAANPATVKNNSACTVTFSVVLDDGTIIGPITLAPGTGVTGKLPANRRIVRFIVNGVTFGAPPPGACVLTGFLCPAAICNVGGIGQNYQFL